MKMGRYLVSFMAIVPILGCAVPVWSAGEERPGVEPLDQKSSASAQFRQVDFSADELHIDNQRLSLLKGHVVLTLVPREPADEPVTFEAGSARCLYDSEESKEPDRVVAEGTVTMVQGTYRFTTDKATWYGAEGRVLCEGDCVVTSEGGTSRAERIEYYFATQDRDARMVAYKVDGTWEIKESVPDDTDVQETVP